RCKRIGVDLTGRCLPKRSGWEVIIRGYLPELTVYTDEFAGACPDAPDFLVVKRLDLPIFDSFLRIDDPHQLRHPLPAVRVERIDAMIELVAQLGLVRHASCGIENRGTARRGRRLHLGETINKIDPRSCRVQ